MFDGHIGYFEERNQTELSSVGRALDCSGCSQQSKGRWFDSGSSDFFTILFCVDPK